SPYSQPMPAAHWEEVLEFWFGDVTSDPLRNRALWFSASPATDALMRERFLPLVLDAEAGRLDAWREDPHGCLALILLTDQFPRNIFRGKPDAFRFDAYALELSHHAREAGYDRILHPVACVFLYLPLEHAEDL